MSRRGAIHAVLTGATGGIGAETAGDLARHGYRLTLLGRDADRLAGLCERLRARGADVTSFALDLSDTGAADNIVRRIAAERGAIDVLINNAAVTWFGRFAAMEPAEIDRLVGIDLVAPLQLARAALPSMLARRTGTIVNIGSGFGSVGFSGFTAYSACKFALRGFSEALRRELRGTGVAVVYVAPRYTRTAANAGAIERMAAALGLRSDEPARVARRVRRAIERREAEALVGWPESLLMRINGAFPRLIDAGFARTTDRILRVVDGAPETIRHP